MGARGVNRVVMMVWDLDEGMAFYEKLLGATFEQSDGTRAAEFGVQAAMAWNAGIELVAPLPDVPSHAREHLETHGEGIAGVVFAVDDADEALASAEGLGLSAYFSLDYTQDEIDETVGGNFTKYKQHFIAAAPPLSGSVLVGEYEWKKTFAGPR